MSKKWSITLVVLFIVVCLIFAFFIINTKFIKNVSSIQTPAFMRKDKTLISKVDAKVVSYGGQDAIQFKRVVTSTADNTDQHFKVDILILTTDDELTAYLNKNKQMVYLIITSTLSTFKYKDVTSIEGKQFLKNNIKNELEKKFGHGVIKDIFFENFVFG